MVDTDREAMRERSQKIDVDAFPHWDDLFYPDLKKVFEDCEQECCNKVQQQSGGRFPQIERVGVYDLTLEEFSERMKGYALNKETLKDFYKELLKQLIMCAKEKHAVIYLQLLDKFKAKEYLIKVAIDEKVRSRGSIFSYEFANGDCVPAIIGKHELEQKEWTIRCEGVIYFYQNSLKLSFESFCRAFAISEFLFEEGKRSRANYRKTFENFLLDIETVYTFAQKEDIVMGARKKLLRRLAGLKGAPEKEQINEFYIKFGSELFSEAQDTASIYPASIAILRDAVIFATLDIKSEEAAAVVLELGKNLVRKAEHRKWQLDKVREKQLAARIVGSQTEIAEQAKEFYLLAVECFEKIIDRVKKSETKKELLQKLVESLDAIMKLETDDNERRKYERMKEQYEKMLK